MNIYETMADLKSLPVPKTGCRAHYEGSIDKKGGNADWDWALYRDADGEWVLFEHLGPGCIYNFVQHRYPSCEEPVFRFYFDGEETPRFTIRHSEFGEKYPFTEPLASRYIGPYDNGRGPIRVVRSFVPMPYKKSCKITSSIRLEGCDRSKNQGGWGHVVYHSYENGDGVETFSPAEDPAQQRLTALWKQTGSCIHSLQSPLRRQLTNLVLKPGEEFPLFTCEESGCIAGIRILTGEYTASQLHTLSLSARWDGHSSPDFDASFGCLFSNELGYHSVQYLLSGMNTDGYYYNFYPMPFSHSADLALKNTGDLAVQIPFAEILWTREWNPYYQENGFLYFRGAPYYSRKHTEGADSLIAQVSGNGHIISSIITAYGETPESRADCEGDVRIHFDGLRTPQIESDGSESYSCYGWGFETPKECNPASGYDGHEHKDWSMHRSLPGDWYPFSSCFRFGIESGGCNDLYMEHSGMVFYYGRDEIKLKKIGEIQFQDPGTLEAFHYICEDSPVPVSLTSFFEGDDDHIPVTFYGHYSRKKRSFTVPVPPDAQAVILRRVSDQKYGRQKAFVSIDNEAVEEYPWYFPDHNPYKRWLEDEFIIPRRYLAGKSDITITIEPQPCGSPLSPDHVTWNEYGYQIFARI